MGGVALATAMLCVAAVRSQPSCRTTFWRSILLSRSYYSGSALSFGIARFSS